MLCANSAEIMVFDEFPFAPSLPSIVKQKCDLSLSIKLSLQSRRSPMKATPTLDLPSCWPSLPFDSWRDTCATLHMWTQIVGKIRLAQTPLINHWWNVPLYVTSRGLTTSSIPYGERSFELSFDFIGHQLVLETNDGGVDVLKLEPQSVADFYQKCMAMLRCADIDVQIWPVPVEIPDPIPFDQDRKHSSYDPDAPK